MQKFDLKKDKLISKLISGSFVSISFKVFSGLAMYVLSILVVREIGSEQSGIFFYGFSFVIILSALSRFGFDHLLLREISKSKAVSDFETIKHISFFSVFFSLIFCLIITLLIFIIFNIFPELAKLTQTTSTLKVMLLSLSFVTLTHIFRLCLQGLSKISFSLILENTLYGSTMILFLIIFNIVDALMLSYYYLIANIICTISGMILWIKCLDNISMDFQKILKKSKLLKDSFFYWISVNSDTLIQCFSIITLGFYGFFKEASYFLIAQQTSMLASFIYLASDKIFAPQVSELFKLNKESEAKRLIIFSTRMMAFLSTPILIFVVVFSSNILSFIGNDYEVARFCLIFLTFAQFSRVVFGNSYSTLAMKGLERLVSKISIISVIFCITMNITLINLVGLDGAALASGLTIILFNFLCFINVKRHLGFYPFFATKYY